MGNLRRKIATNQNVNVEKHNVWISVFFTFYWVPTKRAMKKVMVEAVVLWYLIVVKINDTLKLVFMSVMFHLTAPVSINVLFWKWRRMFTDVKWNISVIKTVHSS